MTFSFPGVYPRVCGGTLDMPPPIAAISGLSPRVRGNPHFERQRTHPRGSIPACAGEPAAPLRAGSGNGVYPRVCGGTSGVANETSSARGLSPRVRGNRVAITFTGFGLGSIPACAGEPPQGAKVMPMPPVYPRVCGGTNHFMAALNSAQGLSPRVRGNPRRTANGAGASRSIPACAGEPWKKNSLPVAGQVYPRVCGGTFMPPWINDAGRGLSPRVRGNRMAGGRVDGYPRSIPACAGEPPRP